MRIPSFVRSPQRGVAQSLALGLAALVVVYAATLALFFSEGEPQWVETADADKPVPMTAQLTAVDLQRDVVTFSFVPTISPDDSASSRRLKASIEVTVDAGSVVQQHVFKKGEVPTAWQVSVPLAEGDVLLYPLDKHFGAFNIKARTVGGKEGVPEVDLVKVVHGFGLVATGEPNLDEGGLWVSFEVQRSRSAVFLAFMAMLSITAVVISAVVVVRQVLLGVRKGEFGMVTWAATLMFVIPTVRNTLPNSPPVGALIDFGLFFWLQVGVAAVLVLLVRAWFLDGKKA